MNGYDRGLGCCRTVIRRHVANYEATLVTSPEPRLLFVSCAQIGVFYWAYISFVQSSLTGRFPGRIKKCDSI